MRILSIDSSGLVASVAIVEDNVTIAEYTINHKKTHSQTLLPMLDELRNIRYFIYLIAGVVLIAYLPCSLFMRAAQQVQNTPSFKKPLHYKLTDEGIRVSQGENEENQGWDSCVKAVSTSRSIIIYTSKTAASIFPKKDLGDKKEALIKIISTNMPPKKVKIRF